MGRREEKNKRAYYIEKVGWGILGLGIIIGFYLGDNSRLADGSFNLDLAFIVAAPSIVISIFILGFAEIINLLETSANLLQAISNKVEPLQDISDLAFVNFYKNTDVGTKANNKRSEHSESRERDVDREVPKEESESSQPLKDDSEFTKVPVTRKKGRGMWFCSCGAVNDADNIKCSDCGKV